MNNFEIDEKPSILNNDYF